MPQDLQFTIGESTQEIWEIFTNSSTDFTVEGAGVVVLADAPVGQVSIHLPACAVNVDRMITVKKIDSTTNSVVINPNGSETIDGSTTKTLTVQYASLTIISDGTEWHIL
jgi:uncharacterized membrane protein